MKSSMWEMFFIVDERGNIKRVMKSMRWLCCSECSGFLMLRTAVFGETGLLKF